MRGYFGIGIYHNKSSVNIGTLWRSASQLGASFIFTIGRRYKKQSSDTLNVQLHMPCYNYLNTDEFLLNIPNNCIVVGIETNGKDIKSFSHPERAIYLLGAEDHGLSNRAIEICHNLIKLPSVRTPSYNVSVAGSLVLYDRFFKAS